MSFFKKWWFLLVIGLVGGMLFGACLKQFGSKSVYKSSVMLQAYHLKPKNMSEKDYSKLKQSERNSVSKYSVVVKSYDTLQAVNDSLHYNYGVWINNVDLGQMFESNVDLKKHSLIIVCISSSKELSKHGAYTMSNILKKRIRVADESMNVSLRIMPGYIEQHGNKNVIFYSGVVGAFVMLMIAFCVEFGGLIKRHGDYSEAKGN